MIEKLHYHHRVQISRAQFFIRQNLKTKIQLDELSKYSGLSKYHFIRIFYAYLGETPIEYVRRLRVCGSLKHIKNRTDSVTNIALNFGFDSSSSFNKAFRNIIGMSPTKFRNIGEEESLRIMQIVFVTKKTERIKMNLNISEQMEIIERKEVKVFTLEASGGKFNEIAPMVWSDFLSVLEGKSQDLSESEFLGISSISNNGDHIYKAAVSSPGSKKLNFDELQEETLPSSKYAKFLLKGSHRGVWLAFDYGFKSISEKGYKCSQAPCLENYLNDPSQTPEEELLTEILIPIE